MHNPITDPTFILLVSHDNIIHLKTKFYK